MGFLNYESSFKQVRAFESVMMVMAKVLNTRKKHQPDQTKLIFFIKVYIIPSVPANKQSWQGQSQL